MSETNRQVDGKLAAINELYALLIACRRNRGQRTYHVFAPEFAELVAERAEHEGFKAYPPHVGEIPGAIVVELPEGCE